MEPSPRLDEPAKPQRLDEPSEPPRLREVAVHQPSRAFDKVAAPEPPRLDEPRGADRRPRRDEPTELSRLKEATSHQPPRAFDKVAAPEPPRLDEPGGADRRPRRDKPAESPPLFDARPRRVDKPDISAPPPTTDTTLGTREMPEFTPMQRAPQPVGTEHVARTERRAHPRPAARVKQPAKITPTVDAARDLVIADAVRLVQWGRKWYELAELIARMADRPPLPEVRRILKENKTAIEKKAGGG
ncbi:MAG TPA: hypothetical protein VK437_16160 [Steroidobacteraceae bacterium]|nr:hypothetical protein [Steroidobacteraceae bacterium]